MKSNRIIKGLKFQFGFRSLFILVLIVSVAASIFQATRPIEISIPVVMKFDTQEGMPVSKVVEVRTFGVADSVRRSAAQFQADFESEYGFSPYPQQSEEVLSSRQADWAAMQKRMQKVDFCVPQEATDFLKWLNANFDLLQPLSSLDIIKHDTIEGRGWVDIDDLSVHYFKLAAIDAVGLGKVIDPENWGNDGNLFQEICELSGDSFRVEAHDVDETQIVRLLVNGRVYRFEMSDDWSWYDDRPACDVLNALLEHEGLDERFFVFKEEYGNSYVRLVMFGEPSRIRKLVDTFDEFEVVDGCEIYWQDTDK